MVCSNITSILSGNFQMIGFCLVALQLGVQVVLQVVLTANYFTIVYELNRCTLQGQRLARGGLLQKGLPRLVFKETHQWCKLAQTRSVGIFLILYNFFVSVW